MFGEVPRGSVLLVWGAERTHALVYQQLVLGARPDVSVVAANGLVSAWYRDQASRQLGVTIPSTDTAHLAHTVAGVAGVLAARRPVFLDVVAARTLHRQLDYRPVGLVARFLKLGAGPGQASAAAVDSEVQRDVDAAQLTDAAWSYWPNFTVRGSYEAALIEVARLEVGARNVAAAERALSTVVAVDARNRLAQRDLDQLRSGAVPH
jgi:hypothetical protein